MGLIKKISIYKLNLYFQRIPNFHNEKLITTKFKNKNKKTKPTIICNFLY